MTHDLVPESTSSKADAIKRAGRSLTRKATHEVKQFVEMFVYLFALFALFAIHESMILAEHSLTFGGFGLAFVNSLVLAKVMLVAQDLHLAGGFRNSPLIYPVLFNSVIFAVLFIAFHIFENVAIGMWHGRTMAESVPGIGGGGLKGLLSASVVVAAALIPYFAFQEISRVIGASALHALIFTRGPRDVEIECRFPKRSRDVKGA